jgi:uncharacterized metal-binding protein YceD (DUF177 family)
VTRPEFSRCFALDRLGSAPQAESIAAGPAERAALCARFGWLSLDRLEAEVVLIAVATGIEAKGQLRAALAQACVVTGDSVFVTIDDVFAVRFVSTVGHAEGEIELAADDLDVMPIEDDAIDLGEAAAQTLALALDPYPRAAGADAMAATLGAEEAGPFAGLKDLLKRG